MEKLKGLKFNADIANRKTSTESYLFKIKVTLEVIR
jgi:hypothetical protein